MGSYDNVSILSTIAAGAQVGAAVGSAYQSYETGVATAKQDKQKARVIGEQAAQQQITMRQNMLRALATQNAAGLGNGVNRAGALRQITENQNDIMVSKTNAATQMSLLDQAAGNAMRSGEIGAGVDVLKGIASIAGDA